VSKRGKNYQKAKSLKEEEKAYTVEEAAGLLKKAAYAKFDESVDIAMKLGVNPKYSDQMVRGTVVLPHGTGQTKKSVLLPLEKRSKRRKKPVLIMLAGKI